VIECFEIFDLSRPTCVPDVAALDSENLLISSVPSHIDGPESAGADAAPELKIMFKKRFLHLKYGSIGGRAEIHKF
jgi:hypothetical protein